MKVESAKPIAQRHPRRVRTPTLLQMEAADCGAASLGIILGYFGRFVPLSELRESCGVSRDGSKASNLVRAAQQYGLISKGLKLNLEEVQQTAAPFVIFWKFNHFLVVEGFTPKWVFLNDPARGRYRVSHQEFDRAYTGVTLTFRPGPQFQSADARVSIYSALWPRLAGSLQALVYVILIGLFLVIPGLVIPSLGRIFVDEILIGSAHDWLMPLLLAMGLTLMLRGALVALQRHYLARLETKLALAGASRFLWHLLRLPATFFGVRHDGDLSSRVDSNEELARLLSFDLAENAINLIVIIFYAALIFSYDRLLCAVATGTALLNFALLHLLGRQRGDQNLRLQQDSGKLYGIGVSGIQLIESLKASGAENDFFARMAGYQTKVINAEQVLAGSNAFFLALVPLLSALNGAAILGIGALRVMDGRLSMGELIAVQSLMAGFLAPIGGLVGLASTLQIVKGTLRRLEDVLLHPEDVGLPLTGKQAAEDSPRLQHRVRLTGAIELRELTFGYSRLSAPLVENFSLTLRPGSRVALVGGSGSGKSTVAKLVSGLLHPWTGSIRFDGELRQEIPRMLLRTSLSVVDQDIFLFEGTIRENITMWDASIPEQQIVAAAKDAMIHDEISQRERGYEGLVEEGGRNFSGGQRQRLELARALVLNPSIVILDEGTSALDPVTELLVDRNLRRRGCTCLIVAHRLSSIRDCEEILVMDGGKVIERGTHEHLIQRNGPYAQLLRTA